MFRSKLKSYLHDTQKIRNDADYRDISISQKTAQRQLERTKEFIVAIKIELPDIYNRQHKSLL